MAIVLTKSNVVDEVLSGNAEKRRPDVGPLCLLLYALWLLFLHSRILSMKFKGMLKSDAQT